MSSPAAHAPVGADAPILHVMRTMRAMRRLRPDPVRRELLEQLVDAAAHAPSATEGERLAFVVVTDRDQMRELARLWADVVDLYRQAVGSMSAAAAAAYEREARAVDYQVAHFAEIPAVVVACYRPGSVYAQVARRLPAASRAALRLGPRRTLALARNMPRGSAVADAGSVFPAVENLLLAARALGLGAMLTNWHLALEGEFKRVLGIPRSVRTYALVPIGWPRGRFGPVTRPPAAELIHWDRW